MPVHVVERKRGSRKKFFLAEPSGKLFKGNPHGGHPTREKANKHMAAVNAGIRKSKGRGK